jgi:hypothetical protein
VIPHGVHWFPNQGCFLVTFWFARGDKLHFDEPHDPASGDYGKYRGKKNIRAMKIAFSPGFFPAAQTSLIRSTGAVVSQSVSCGH